MKKWFWPASVLCFLVVGCNQREDEKVVIVPPQTIIKNTEETQIKSIPREKTVVVKQSPQPTTQVKTETRVNIDGAPNKTPNVTATPQSRATPITRLKPATTPTPTPTPHSTLTSRPTPTAVSVRAAATQSALVTVRAEIVSTSAVPDPQTVAYKDSIVFHKYRVLSILNGVYNEKEILAAHWGIRNKKLQPAARYRIGQVQTLRIEPMARHPELESLQSNDDTGEFSLDPYWVVSVS